MNRLTRAGGLGLALALARSPAAAQPSAAEPGRIEVAVGAVRIARVPFARRDAEETAGGGGTFRLFSSASELTGRLGLGGRLSVSVMRRLDAEAAATYSAPELRTRIDDDAEASNAPAIVTVRVQQFTLGGAAVWYTRVPRLGSRIRPFARGGIALERRLEDGGRRVVNGRMFEAGVGAKYLAWSRASGWWKGIGARADALALVRSRAVTLDGRTHVSPAFAAAVFLRF